VREGEGLTGNVAGPTAGTPPAVESQSPIKASLILATLDLLETPRLPRRTPELISLTRRSRNQEFVVKLGDERESQCLD
jgi:hypothetical protein